MKGKEEVFKISASAIFCVPYLACGDTNVHLPFHIPICKAVWKPHIISLSPSQSMYFCYIFNTKLLGLYIYCLLLGFFKWVQLIDVTTTQNLPAKPTIAVSHSGPSAMATTTAETTATSRAVVSLFNNPPSTMRALLEFPGFYFVFVVVLSILDYSREFFRSE